MISKIRCTTPLTALVFALSGWNSNLVAAPVITTITNTPAAGTATTSTTDETIYNSFISTTDLLHGLAGTGGAWNISNGANPTGLNNGTGAGDANVSVPDGLTGAAWAADGTASFREFAFGNGANGLGFNITEVQSIAAWQGASFQNQHYQILVSTVGSASFTLLATVNFQPASGSSGSVQGGATKVNVTDSSGILATGVDAIRFNILDASGATAGGTVFREFDVSGVPTPGDPDVTPPILNTLTSVIPADDATGVSVSRNLEAAFSEPIALGSGSITIKNQDTASQTLIALPDARVSVSGALLTVNPSTNLAASTNHAVRISAGAITDLSGNPFGGIDNDTTWNFRTASAPLRIMCLGDSITAGYTDNPAWTNHRFEFGYRSGLYTLLTNAGYNFLFVGGSTEPWTGISGDPTYGGTYKPPLDLRDFGQDGHRGYGGKTASFLNSNIVAWLATDNPDIILLKVGTNSQDQTGLNTLVNTITTNKPNCHLIIAEIMPKYTYQAGIVTYNNHIRDTLVPDCRALGKKVTLVNHYTPFLTNPAVLTSIDTSLFSNGINHPDNDGYDKMAQVWFNGIELLGVGPNTFTRWISGFPGVGSQTGLAEDPDRDGVDNGVENYFGTDPARFSRGLVAGNKTGNSFTFTHPQNSTPAIDVAALYQWSKDLVSFQASGATDAGGTTVTLTAQQNSPSPGITTVTAVMSGALSEKLFFKVTATSE